MSEPQQDEAIPTDVHAAAVWLMDRHPWVASLVQRVLPGVDFRNDNWLDDLALVMNAYDAHQEAVSRYVDAHPAPHDDARWEAWDASKPDVVVTTTDISDEDRARVLAGVDNFYPMSGGEQRVVRLVATQARRRVQFSFFNDVDFDERGVAFYLDLVRTVEHTSISVRFYTHPDTKMQRARDSFDRFEERIARGENPV